MKRPGFTVIEITAVVGIIAVLAAVVFPVFARARESARRNSCANNLAQIGVALHLYAQAFDGRFPPGDNEFGSLLPYAAVKLFYCPSDSREKQWEVKPAGQPGASTPGGRALIAVRTYSSYVYRGGLTTADRADTAIAGEARLFHATAANELYLGGRVAGVPAQLYSPVVKPSAEQIGSGSEKTGLPDAPPLPR